MFAHIPHHLQAKAGARSLKMTSMTKAQKLELQLKMADDRIAK